MVLVSVNSYAKVIYVDLDAPGANNGTTWENAYNILQDALSEAVAEDELLLAEGTYRPDENTANPSGTGNAFEYFRINEGVLGAVG